MAAISLLNYLAQSRQPMRKGLVQRITNVSQFLKLLMFIQIDGFTYEYQRQDTLGGIAFRALNGNYTADTGMVNPQKESTAILGGTVGTDRQFANKPTGAATRANNIAAKVKKAGLFYDLNVIKGDPATNALSFYGLNSRLNGSQVITPANATNGAALDLATLDRAIDQTVGGTSEGKIIVCNKYIRRQITQLLRGFFRYIDIPGFTTQVLTYNDCPIIVLDEDGDEQPILSENETQGSSSATTSLYVIRLGSDTEGEYVQGLVGSNMIEHEATGLIGTSYQDVVEMNAGIAVFHPRAATRVKGLL